MSDPSTYASQDTNKGNYSGSNPFRTPPSEERERLLPESTTNNIDNELAPAPKDTKGKLPEVPRHKRTRRRRPRKHHRHHSDSTVESAETAVKVLRDAEAKEDRALTMPENGAKQLQPPPIILRRTSSNSGVDERSRHDAVAGSPKPEGRSPPQEPSTRKARTKRPWRLQRSRKTSPPIASTESGSPVIEFKWFPVRNRSNSDPASIPQPKPRTLKRGKEIPLKPSLKTKSKSTTTTPPTEQVLNSESAQERQKLRKVKTVEFQEVSQKLLSLPPLKVWAEESNPSSSVEPQPSKLRAPPGRFCYRPSDALRRTRSCLAPKTKGEPAGAAITRTDVHVVAVTPSSGPTDIAELDSIGQPPTPTMQIVESKTGRYEVVWDDVADIQPEHDLRGHRRSSSASQSLHAAASSTSKGLERVSSKLSEWSVEGGPPSAQFSPQVVVFPDDDCRIHAPLEDIVVDEDTLPIFTPPNSIATTAAASRQSSGPASARTSRLPSHDMSHEAHDSDSDTDGLVQKETTHKVVSDKIVYPASPNHLKEASNHGSPNTGKKKPLINRRLSNLEDSDVHFRDHRDSVALARDRIIPSGNPGPEYYMHRDSVSKAMAKKRLRTQGHSNSSVQKSVYANRNDEELLLPAVAVEISSPAKSKKMSAVKSLKNSASASMFPERGPPPHRHIRIME